MKRDVLQMCNVFNLFDNAIVTTVPAVTNVFFWQFNPTIVYVERSICLGNDNVTMLIIFTNVYVLYTFLFDNVYVTNVLFVHFVRNYNCCECNICSFCLTI